MDVLILAGGKCDPELAAETGVEYRALLPFQGKPILDRVMAAVQGVGRIILVSDFSRPNVENVPAGASFVGSIENGIKAVQSPTFLLVMADIPWITAEAIQDYLSNCNPDALLNYPIIPIEEAEERFPGMKRTTWKLRAGTFTGGNIVLMNTKLMRQSIPKLNEAYANRKNVLKIAKMLGFSTLVQFAIGKKFPKTMVIERLEKSVGRFLGGPIKVVVTKFAEIGADIDSAEQYNQLKNFE